MGCESKQLLLCNCNQTIPVDVIGVSRALGLDQPLEAHTQLCRRQAGAFQTSLRSGSTTIVGCTQESQFFNEIKEKLNPDPELRFVNLHYLGRGSPTTPSATPSIAAALALAGLPDAEPVPGVTYRSAGELLIIGEDAAAVQWAERLADQLEVSVLFSSAVAAAELPLERRYPVYSGGSVSVRGYLGAFDVSWQQDNPIDLELCTRCNACIAACPEQAIGYSYQIDLQRCTGQRECVKACGAIGAIDFQREAVRRTERFDLVLDLSCQPLIGLPQPPQGYLAPGNDPLQQALAALQLLQMVGEFEKPKYFAYREKICAHSRSRVEGCNQCVEICSTGAISSEGDHVKVDPHLCMGCGACATVCPSGAMSYAYPSVAVAGLRLKTALQTYLRAGGQTPCILFHNGGDGRDLIGRARRRGAGLPAHVIPIEVFHTASIGMELMLGAIAYGANRLVVLSAGSETPDYRAALRQQMKLAQQILSGLGYGQDHLLMLECSAAEPFDDSAWNTGAARAPRPASFNLSNEKRGTLDFVLDHLAKHAPRSQECITLQAGAPFGAVDVDQGKCTLCLACVGACPEGALLDSKTIPAVKFIERNCVQCGLCERTCPEDAIRLAPRLLLTKEALSERVLHQAEPFHCVSCGKPFGTRQMIDSMLGRLQNHSMFAAPGALERLRMCADCRVVDLMKNADHGSILDLK
jgi:ferredoxin